MKHHQNGTISPTNFNKVVSIAEGFKQNTPLDMSLLWQSLVNLPLQD
jgi:hypothetical protein